VKKKKKKTDGIFHAIKGAAASTKKERPILRRAIVKKTSITVKNRGRMIKGSKVFARETREGESRVPLGKRCTPTGQNTTIFAGWKTKPIQWTEGEKETICRREGKDTASTTSKKERLRKEKRDSIGQRADSKGIKNRISFRERRGGRCWNLHAGGRKNR